MKPHVVSAEGESVAPEFTESLEMIEHMGEDNSTDEVLDIIVLPDQQVKQRHHPPAPYDGSKFNNSHINSKGMQHVELAMADYFQSKLK